MNQADYYRVYRLMFPKIEFIHFTYVKTTWYNNLFKVNKAKKNLKRVMGRIKVAKTQKFLQKNS
jgi:hypothetical protein